MSWGFDIKTDSGEDFFDTKDRWFPGTLSLVHEEQGINRSSPSRLIFSTNLPLYALRFDIQTYNSGVLSIRYVSTDFFSSGTGIDNHMYSSSNVFPFTSDRFSPINIQKNGNSINIFSRHSAGSNISFDIKIYSVSAVPDDNTPNVGDYGIRIIDGLGSPSFTYIESDAVYYQKLGVYTSVPMNNIRVNNANELSSGSVAVRMRYPGITHVVSIPIISNGLSPSDIVVSLIPPNYPGMACIVARGQMIEPRVFSRALGSTAETSNDTYFIYLSAINCTPQIEVFIPSTKFTNTSNSNQGLKIFDETGSLLLDSRNGKLFSVGDVVYDDLFNRGLGVNNSGRLKFTNFVDSYTSITGECGHLVDTDITGGTKPLYLAKYGVYNMFSLVGKDLYSYCMCTVDINTITNTGYRRLFDRGMEFIGTPYFIVSNVDSQFAEGREGSSHLCVK